MVKEKRTKPCSNCKKSKVKCIYNTTLPCERCIKIGQINNCQFIPKLPSLKLPILQEPQTLPPFNPLHHPTHTHTHVSEPYLISSSTPLGGNSWQTQIENRMNNFDVKVNDLVEMLRMNQQYIMQVQQQQQQQLLQQQQQQAPQQRNIPSHPTKRALETGQPSRKRQKLPQDFRDGYLTKSQACELFKFFDTNISQQLFGFEISKFTVDSLWDSCPVLVCAISTIASIHHPQLHIKSTQLQVYLHELCQKLLFQGKPQNETDGLNTIIALILCSFWMSDSQMFTGLALQLAKQYGLNDPNNQSKTRLKIWYLLYILDGQQSLTFNRQPLVNSQDYSLVHSRELLLTPNKQELYKIEDKQERQGQQGQEEQEQEIVQYSHKQRFTDMRLVSQVEYNQAINEAFKGNAWDLLSPATFGIPSKTNLELDKWMVSWTVLLAPGNYGAVWSTKSTLIYYNFAKMHINSSAVRQLQIDPNDTNFPKWDNSYNPKQIEPIEYDKEDSDSNSDSDSDSDSSNEFISNKELLSRDEAVINANIAVNAAQTVLNLVINDKDIIDNLKYIPVHIHIMLYYAALLLINPPLKSNNKSIQYSPENYYRKLIDNLSIINILKKRIYSNLPIDVKFGNRLIKSLEDIEMEKLTMIKQFVKTLSGEIRDEFDQLVNNLLESSDNIEELRESSGSRGSTPERISAWPGSHHGHP